MRLRTCNQSAPALIVSEHAFPSSAKSAERIEGAMMAGGDIAAALSIGRGLGVQQGQWRCGKRATGEIELRFSRREGGGGRAV